MINWLLKPLGYDTIQELLNSLFLTNQYHLLIFLFSFFTVINSFIESYIWAQPAQYWFLIMLILLDFFTGLLKAIKYKILIPKKIPRFIITIISYTLLLYVSFYGASVIDLLFWLPTLLYSLFILITLLSFVQNLYALNFIPAIVKNFFENQIGYRLSKSLNLEIDDESVEHKIKIQTLISQLLYKTKADKVILCSFKNETFDNKFVTFLEVPFEKINLDKINQYPSSLNKVNKAEDIDFILSELTLRDYLKIELNNIENRTVKNILKGFGVKQYAYAFKIAGVQTNTFHPFVLFIFNHNNTPDFNLILPTFDLIAKSLNKIKENESKKNKSGEITDSTTPSSPKDQVTNSDVPDVDTYVIQNETFVHTNGKSDDP